MNIAYFGPFRDYSGYGEANRHDIAALHTAGVNVEAQLVSYTVDTSDFGDLGKLMTELSDNKCDYRIKIMHTTPNEFQRLIEPGKYHIGRFFWETDKVPDDFARGLKLCDEIWTGSQANVDAIRAAGVERPCYIIPQATETGRKWPDPFQNEEFKDRFMFYSIFEWTERKNPTALLTAYWKEFQAGEHVGLLIKSYFKNFTLQNKNMITDQISSLKKRLDLETYPDVFLYKDLMDRKQIMQLHKTGDCFVSAHRGEGWGVPQVEAMLAGKPVISTGYGGVHEYLTDRKTALITPYAMVPVRGMNHSSFWYMSDQKWADITIDDLRRQMRWVYENQKQAKAIGTSGRKSATIQFNFKRVGKLMAERLAEIEKTL